MPEEELDEQEEEKQGAEGVLKRASAQLEALAKRGLDVASLEKKIEAAQMDFAQGNYHEAEIAAGEVIVLAKATAEMARMSSNVAKQEDAVRKQVAESVRAELARALPQSAALDNYVKNRLLELLPDFLSADDFQQAVLGISEDAARSVAEEIEAQISTAEEKILSEAAETSRSTVASLLSSSDLADKIKQISSKVAVEQTAAFPRSDDVEETAKRVTREALANMLDSLAGKQELESLREELSRQVESRVSAVPSEEEIQALAAGAAQEVADSLTSNLQALQSEVSSNIESLQTEVSSNIESIRSEAAETLDSLKQEVQSAIEEVKSESLSTGAVKAITKDVAEEAVGAVLSGIPSREDMDNLSSELREELEKRLSALPTAEELAHSAAEAAQQEVTALSEELRSELQRVAGMAEDAAAKPSVSADDVAEQVGEVKSELRAQMADYVSRLREEVEEKLQQAAQEREQVSAGISSFQQSVEENLQKAVSGVRSEAASAAELEDFRQSVEERLSSMLSSEDFEEQVKQAVQPLIDEVRSSVIDQKTVENIANAAAAAATEDVPRYDPQELEDQILEKVAPIVGALIGSDQFSSNISMVVGQRIDDVIDSRGLLTHEQAESAITDRVMALSRKFVTKDDLNELRKAVLKKGGKGEADIQAAVDALKAELAEKDLGLSEEQVEEIIAGKLSELQSSIDEKLGALSTGPDMAEVEKVVEEKLEGLSSGAGAEEVENLVEDKLSALKAELNETIVAQAAGGVDEGVVIERMNAVREEAVKAATEAAREAAAVAGGGVDEAALDEKLAALKEEVLAAASKAAPEGAGGGITEQDLEEHLASFKFDILGSIRETVLSDEEFRSSVVGDAVSEQLAEFYRRLPKSKPLQDVIQQAVAEAGGGAQDPDALKGMVQEAVQSYLAENPPGGAAVDPEQVQAALAEQPAGGAAELPSEVVSEAVQGELMSVFADPEYVKSIFPVPEGMDLDKVEKVAGRAARETIVNIFDSEEFAKRVHQAVGGAAGAAEGGGGGVTQEDIRAALVEFMESDLFADKVAQVAGQAGGGGAAGEAAGAAELQIQAAAQEIRDDLSNRMAKVEEALPDIVTRVAQEKGLGGGVDEETLDRKVSELVAAKISDGQLDLSVIQAQVNEAIPDALVKIAASDEFKEALDDKFKIILKYLKDDVIPKQVKKVLKKNSEGG